MATYILTAFSFLAANFGWFSGMPQTEIFFWASIIVSCILIVVILALFVLVASQNGIRGSIWLAALMLLVGAVVCLVNILVAWVCTMLWAVDFYLAYQLMCIGSATAGLIKVNSNND